MPARHPRGDTTQAVGCVSVQLRGKTELKIETGELSAQSWYLKSWPVTEKSRAWTKLRASRGDWEGEQRL